jgi:uncharacterized protein
MNKMNDKRVIKITEEFAKKSTISFDSGHDWWHLHRVRNIALHLQKLENRGNRLIIEVAALLHDIDDKKFRTDTSKSAEAVIRELLFEAGTEESLINEVISINKYVSFSSESKPEIRSIEFLIVQDADRLDAIGAIGIARAFNYGGFRNNAIYIPETDDYGMPPSTIGHFYDKLLLLKDMMNTPTAIVIAKERHLFLEQFLKQFYSEWNLAFHAR